MDSNLIGLNRRLTEVHGRAEVVTCRIRILHTSKKPPSIGADRTESACSSPLFPSYQQELTGHAADGD